MPPRSRGVARGRGRRNIYNGRDLGTEEVLDIISIGSESDTSSVIMTGQRPVTRETQSQRPSRLTKTSQSAVPDVYHDMLSEALASSSRAEDSDTPRKRRKLKQADVEQTFPPVGGDAEEGEENDIQFEDVFPDVSDDDSEEDFEWEEVGMADPSLRPIDADDDGDINLHLHATPREPKGKSKRSARVFSRAERAFHLEMHKLHILCLLRHVDIRNDWCNDNEVQNALSPLISEKLRKFLNPEPEWSQFRRTDSLKRGLDQLADLWESKFKITARGMRRSFWAADEDDLKKFKLPSDFDPPLSKNDFRNAARKLEGSRDIGAQLYCALLRSVGVETRLVCSLQALPLSASVRGFPSRPGESSPAIQAATSESSDEGEPADFERISSPFGEDTSPMSVRRRLGHPNAADYHLPEIQSPAPRLAPRPKRRRIHESRFPVFWIEVLDEAHQKWMPVDPLVTHTINKPRVFEPPASDIENNMHYVFAFESEGTARDVTRRYTKWFLAKTRKNRVESTEGGERWLRRTLRFYSRGWTSDLEQIEDVELAAAEAREGMPTSIADFKDHPRYVLERDLKRNEVLIHRHEVGKVAAGRDTNSPSGKRLESVFRRSDVRAVKSADGWYRVGRDIKLGEQPVKTRPSTAKKKLPIDDDDEPEDEMDTALYTIDQTELYEPPPVLNGRVPRNRYGNIDVYVPTMIPKGGIHIPYSEASHAAQILGIDYATAVTGFEFRARRGRPVLTGIVVAEEYREAVEAVVDGFRDEVARAEEEIKADAAVAMWRKFLIGLRVKARVDTYEIEGEDRAERSANRSEERQQHEKKDIEVGDPREVKGLNENLNAEEGGGFIPEDTQGGFLPEEEDEEAEQEAELEEDDVGMESEEYYDDGGGGFLVDEDDI